MISTNSSLHEISLESSHIILHAKQNVSHVHRADDSPLTSSFSTATDDNRSSLHSSDSISSPCSGLPPTPPRLDDQRSLINFPSPRSGRPSPRDNPVSYLNSCDAQTHPCSAPSVNTSCFMGISPKLTFESRSSNDTFADQTTIILQPPNHFNLSSELPRSQSALHSLISKPPTQQVQLGLIPLSNHWTPNQNCTHNSRVNDVDNTHCNQNNFPSYTRGEMDGPGIDPFAQLSARTLALMDQPESEVTIYDCEYCDKTYQGKHARSIWRRHLSDKHKIPLSTQPRRTRWDNDANRPKTEEERRERTLESKRRWARKNRAAKKAARDGQRNSTDQSLGVSHPESVLSEPYRGSPNRSRAPSPSSFPISLGHNPSTSLQYPTAPGQLVRGPLTQGEHRGPVSGMARGSSVPHAFSPYPSMASRPSLPFGNASYNSSFCSSQVVTAPEWTFPMPSSQNHSPYSFESVTPSGYSSAQFSDRFANQDLQHNHSPRNFHNLVRRHSSHQQPGEQRELPGCFPSASLTSQHGGWELDARFNISNTLPLSLTQSEASSYEAHVKRPRLSQTSSSSVPLQKFDGLQKSFSVCHIDASGDNRDFQPIGIQDLTKSSVSSNDTPHLNFKTSPQTSVRDEETESELGPIAEEPVHPTDGQDDFHPVFDSPMNSQNRVDDGQSTRPATSGTSSSMSHENEMDRVIPMSRAATEPQFAGQYDLQTPSRELRLRSAGWLHLAHSPLCRADAHCLDATDLLSSPAVTRTDPNTAPLYQGSFAPLSGGKRVMSDNIQIQTFGASGSLSMGDWSSHGLDTPSGFSRFPFSNPLSSPAGSAGLFSSPNSYLSRSLGLTTNNSVAEDCLGGFLGTAGSAWDMVHQRTS